jgi:hypothetical protein
LVLQIFSLVFSGIFHPSLKLCRALVSLGDKSLRANPVVNHVPGPGYYRDAVRSPTIINSQASNRWLCVGPTLWSWRVLSSSGMPSKEFQPHLCPSSHYMLPVSPAGQLIRGMRQTHSRGQELARELVSLIQVPRPPRVKGDSAVSNLKSVECSHSYSRYHVVAMTPATYCIINRQFNVLFHNAMRD